MEQLAEQFEFLKRQYDDMEANYQLQIKQKLTNSVINQANRDLQETREACVAMSNQRDALLDRVLELERAARVHKDAAISTSRGTPRESRLRARLLPSLNESLKPDVDPYASSRHVGPAAVESRNQRISQQQVAAAAAAMHYDQSVVTKADPERSVGKLPKRARASRAAGATGSGRGAASSSSNMHVFPIEPPYPALAMEGDVLQATANGNPQSRSASGTIEERGSNDGRYE